MVSIIINPVAGGASLAQAKARVAVASACLETCGEAGEIVLTEARGHGRELAASAVARGHRLVVAWGGDGTLNEVASSLVGTTTALGIVRAGSGNGLARELNVPAAPDAALRRALSAEPRAIDAGQLGGRWFFTVAGVGFDAHVAAVFDRVGRGRRGLSTYVRITAREFWRYRCGDYAVNGVNRTGVLLLSFANVAQFGNGARIAPSARPDDGHLDLVIVQERSRLATLFSMPSLFNGRVAQMPGVTITPVTESIVESLVPMHFHVDGEPVLGGTRLEARVYPRALRVAA